MLAMEKGGKNVEDARFFGPRVMLLPPKIWNQEQGGGMDINTACSHDCLHIKCFKKKKIEDNNCCSNLCDGI